MAKNNKSLAKVFHHDLYGKREVKYDFLDENNMYSIDWRELQPVEPDYTFKQQDLILLKNYNSGFSPIDLFKINVMGFQTHRDNFAIDFEKQIDSCGIFRFWIFRNPLLQECILYLLAPKWNCPNHQKKKKQYAIHMGDIRFYEFVLW